MTMYKFNDSNGKEYIGWFISREVVIKFAYKAGLCFLGRV